jgi:hypothetical protein
MRLHWCENILYYIQNFLSGERVGVAEMDIHDHPQDINASTKTIRRCANIKSRKVPDAQCALTATYGDYCSRHWKHPHRYVAKEDMAQREVFTRREHAAAERIQKAWKRIRPFLRLFQQGPGVACREQSCNDTELYSLDPIKTIPPLYYISFVGPTGALWSFDVRSLGQLMMRGDLKENPYTREALMPSQLTKITKRVGWLRSRKYSILYPQGTDLTTEQVWRQKVLDVFLRIESYGFHVSCDWFHQMGLRDHEEFYATLYSLWYSRLGLTHQQRESIVPSYETAASRLFRFSPEQGRGRHSASWWERYNLAVIEALLTRSPDKEQRRLGAMYVLMGLVAVCDGAAESFPWLEETIE